MTSDAKLTLDALQAVVDASEGRADQALATLADRNDPESVLARATILLDLKRDSDAHELLRDRALDSRLCVKTVVATARVGRIADVVALIENIDRDFARDGLLRMRCRLVAAEVANQRAFPDTTRSEVVIPELLTTEQREWIDAAAAFLAPTVDHVCSFGSAEHAVEQLSLEHALVFASLRSDSSTAQRIGPILERVYPIPLTYVQGVLRRQFPPCDDIVQRIRSEHEQSWDANVSSIRVEGYILKRPERAALTALSMIRSAPPDYQEELSKALFDLSATLPEETSGAIENLVGEVLPSTSPISVAFRVQSALRKGNLEEADRLLAEMPDKEDPIALQFQAQIFIDRGNKHDARLAIERACGKFRTPGLLELAADLASEEGDWQAASDALARAVALVPADVRIRKKHSHALMQCEMYADAAKEFGELSGLEPEVPIHRYNRAVALAQGGQLNESLDAFREYCRIADFPMNGVLGQAQILIGLDRGAEAFALMQDCRSKFWDIREFVAMFMSASYSAGRDGEAHKAMMRLQEIEQPLEPSKRILRAVSLDEIKDHFTHFRKSDDMLHEQLLRGHIPWLFADSLLKRVPYAAWSYRTQPLLWESDDPLAAARNTVYATNTLQTVDVDGQKELRELSCPDNGATICIDLTALITLHELGMLDAAANYFGSIVIPAQCRDSALEHLQSLVPHQPSRRDAAVAIRTAIESGRINAFDGEADAVQQAIPHLSEIEETDKPVYRLLDLATALRESGALGTDQDAALQLVAHAPSTVGEHLPPLAAGHQVLCDVSTLETLHQQGLLGVCLEAFDVYLTADDRKKVFGTVQAFDAQAGLHEKVRRLLQSIKDNDRFVIAQVSLPRELSDERFFEDSLASGTFAAAFAAVDRGLPLLADDRALQVYASHRYKTQDVCAFSTGALLEVLADAPDADIARLANAYLSLLNWRYRFLVPPAKFLKHYADQFPSHPPGRALRQVAMYAHQCMNDPGLLCGFEPTDPPTSVASRLYFLWIKTWMDFVASCWLDEAYSEERAAQIATWTLTEAIPAAPRMLLPHVQGVIAAQSHSSMLNYLALATATSTNSNRVESAMKALRDGLKLSDAEYLHLVTQLAHER